MRRFLENNFLVPWDFIEYYFRAHFMGFLSESCPRNIFKMSFNYLTLLASSGPYGPFVAIQRAFYDKIGHCEMSVNKCPSVNVEATF